MSSGCAVLLTEPSIICSRRFPCVSGREGQNLIGIVITVGISSLAEKV